MTTVVIVDDEVDAVSGLSELLKMKNIDVVGVGYDGKQAVELCRLHNPDFLLLDLSMPEFDGFYTLENLQDRNQTKIIIMTGLTEEEVLKKLELFKIFSVQIKPLDFKILFKIFNNS